MGYLQRRLVYLLALSLPVAAWAEAFTLSFPAGPLAAWQTKQGALIAVATQAPKLANLPTGWRQEIVAENGVQGVVVYGAKGWSVQRHAAGWALQATPKTKPAPRHSALLLQDGWQLGGTPLVRKKFQAAGSQWQVGLTPVLASQPGAVVGAFQRLGAAPKLAPPAPDKIAGYARLEPAAGLAPSPTPTVQVEALTLEENLQSSLAGVAEVLNNTPSLRPRSGPLGLVYGVGTVVALPKGLPLVKLAAPEAAAVGAESVETVSTGVVISPTLSGKPSFVAGSEDIATTDAEAAGHHEAPVPDTHGDAPADASADVHGEAQSSILARAALPALVQEVVALLPSQTAEADTGVLIPPRGAQYTADVSEALGAVADAPVGSAAARESRLSLAGVYLAWQRPEEAQAVLAALPVRADGLPAGATARLLWGVAAVARLQPNAAAFDQTGSLAPHSKLWAAVAATQQGNFSLTLANWPSAKPLLAEYPSYLQTQAQTAQITAWVMTGQGPTALKALQQMAESYGAAGLPPALQRLQGLAQLGSATDQQGLEALAAAAENKTDVATAIQAKYEFVRALYQRKDISDAQLRSYLRDLQQDWRGDSTEREILTTLADLYNKAGEPSQALQAWQSLLQAYPNTPDIPILTEKMAQAFVQVFDPESAQTFDPLTYLGLYYDFRELLPNDERGDLVQERMAESLIQANLLDRASPILEQQLQYRPLEPVAQGRTVLLLAETYRRQGKPEEALKLLAERQSVASTQVLRRGWIITEARALADLQRPLAAAEVLKPLLATGQPEDLEAAQLAAQVAWAGQDWGNAVAGFNRLLAKVPSSVLVSDTTAQLDTFRLAYALGQTNNATELAALKNRYQEAWAALPQLADDINAVAASSGVSGVPPEGGPLQALTTAMSELNTLNDKIAQSRKQLGSSKAKREEFNARMQYLELLPPPAL